MKGIIIYQGKYGATEQYAQWLSDSLHFSFIEVNAVTPAILAKHDLVMLGSSVYVGKLLLAKWMKRNLSVLAHKKLLLFIVCGTTAENKNEQQKIIENNLDPAIRKAAGVFFLPGRCVVSKLSWMDRFLIKMGAMMQKDPVKKAKMMQGFDRMDRKSLNSLIAAAGKEAKPVPVEDIY
ncbi:hypothetical protein BH09BAC6_BH09BAC6_18690 [soil metagenome]|jgi:menaquinone-dependent protoporphyrinogen IX oxidase